MATQIITTLIDDTDGSDADETIRFGLDGVAYEIDLSKTNARELRDALAVFIASSRRVGGARRPANGTAKRGESPSAKVREWAAQNGYDVPSRGRIPTKVMEAYQEVHGGLQLATITVSDRTPEEKKATRKRAAKRAAPEVAPID